MNVYDLAAKITLDSKEYENGLKEQSKNTASFGSKLGSAFGTMAKASAVAFGGAITAIGGLVKSSVESYSEYEQLVGGVQKLYGNMGMSVDEYAKSVGKSTDEVKGQWENLEKAQNMVLENAKNAYKTAGMDMNTYMNTATSFSASLINSLGGDTVKAAELTDVAMTAISDNFNTFGGDIGMIQNAFQGFAKQNYTMLDNLKLGYGGTKKEMARLIEDANEYAKSIGKAGDLSIESFADIVTAIDLVQQKQQIAGTTAREAATTIQGSLGMLKGAWSNLLTGLADGEADINKLMDNVLESAETVFDNILPVAEKALESISTFISKLAPKIVKELPNLVKRVLPKLLDGARSLVQAVVDVLPSLVETVLKAIVDILPDIVKTIMELIPKLIEALLNALPMVIQAIGEMIPTIIEGLAEIIPQIIQMLAEALPVIIDAILSSLPAIIEALLNALPDIMIAIIEALPVIFEGIATAVIDNFPKILEAIGRGFLAILEKLAEFFAKLVGITDEEGDGILDDIVEWFEDLIEKVVQWFKDIWDKIVKFFTDIWNKISGFFTDVWNKITGFFQNVWNGITTSLSNLWNNITGWFTNLWNKISEFVSSAVNWGVDMVKNLWNGFTSWATNIWNSITSWFSNLWSSITDVFANAWEVGKNLVVGIWNGISDWFQWLWDRISGFFDDIWQGICDFFGIQSPSKEMAWVGNMLVQGLGKGIETNAPKVLGTMEGLAEDMNDIMDGMSGDVAINAVTTVKNGAKSKEEQLQEQLIGVTDLLQKYLPYVALPKELQLDDKVIAGRLAPSMDNEFAGMKTRQNRGVVAWT